MKKTLTLTTALALVLIAGHASAQEMTYAKGTLSSATIDIDGAGEFSAFALEGDVEITYDQMLFGASGRHQVLEYSGLETSTSTYEGFAAYMPTAELMFGAGITGFSFDGSDSFTGYEGFVQYDNGQFGAALLYEMPYGQDEDFAITSLFGRAALTPEVTIGAVIESIPEADQTNTYLSAEYDGGQIFARGYYHSTSDDDGVVYGARGRYDVGQDFFATADFQVIDGGLFGSGNTHYAIGGGYRISETAMVDASIGQLVDDDATANLFRIGLTFETGGRKRLDTTMTDAIRADFANGIRMLVPDVGFGSGFNVF